MELRVIQAKDELYQCVVNSYGRQKYAFDNFATAGFNSSKGLTTIVYNGDLVTLGLLAKSLLKTYEEGLTELEQTDRVLACKVKASVKETIG